MKEITNKTKYAASRVMGVICPICFISFTRPPSRLERNKVSCCSVGCAAEARKIVVEYNCVVCEKPMTDTPSNVERIKTCSAACQSVKQRRKGGKSKPQNIKGYKGAARLVFDKTGCCKECQTNIGPFVIRGIQVSPPSKGAPVFDIERAFVLCRRCHSADIGSLPKRSRTGSL